MKIKQTRQVRLDELIKWIFENDIEDATFYAMNNEDNSVKVHVYIGGFIKTEYLGCPSKSDLFTITEEVEIDGNTVLPRIACVHTKTNNISCYNDISIEDVIKLARFYLINYKSIYLQNPDGSIGELIWSKERGLID